MAYVVGCNPIYPCSTHGGASKYMNVLLSTQQVKEKYPVLYEVFFTDKPLTGYEKFRQMGLALKSKSSDNSDKAVSRMGLS